MKHWRNVRIDEILDFLERRSAATGPYERGYNLDKLRDKIKRLKDGGLATFPVPIGEAVDIEELGRLMDGDDESQPATRKRNRKSDRLIDAIRQDGRENGRGGRA